MPDKETQNTNKYFFWIIIGILIILSYLVIRPFIIPLISAFILAYLSRPAFLFLEPKIGKKMSAVVSVFLITIIFILPLGAIGGGIINQATESLNAKNVNTIFTELSSYPLLKSLNIDLTNLTEKSLSFIISLVKTSLAHLPSIIISILITLLGIYYILISWDELALNLEGYLPFKDKKKIRKEISEITNTLVYGTVLIALIEFIISLNAFLILGVNPYILLSALIFFFAFIPGLGPALVWIPMAIFYLLTNNYFTAIGVIITGLILSIPIDTILRVKLLGNKVKINPIIMLVGILGGIALFGIFGFIIGPLILIYTLKILDTTIKP
jgi:predicted PurR-regulated permease PerM